MLLSLGCISSRRESHNASETFEQARVKYNCNTDWKLIKENSQDVQNENLDDTEWSRASCLYTFNDVDAFEDYSFGYHNGDAPKNFRMYTVVGKKC